VGEEDLAAPSGAERGALDGGEVQKLAPVVAGKGLQASEKGVASLLRLVSAVLSEISEDWETGKVCLNTEGMPA